MSETQQKPLDTAPEHSSLSAEGARIVLILGGARSGKSTFAEKLARNSGRSVAFIATATASDEEMAARITRHQAERPQTWQTIEEPLNLAQAVRQASERADVLLLDCLTLWTSNWLFQHADNTDQEEYAVNQLFGESAQQAIAEMLLVVRALPAHKTLIVVSNEVGLGIVPAYPLGRVYRDTLGYVNQRVARAATRVYLLVAGIAVDLKRLQEEAFLL